MNKYSKPHPNDKRHVDKPAKEWTGETGTYKQEPSPEEFQKFALEADMAYRLSTAQTPEEEIFLKKAFSKVVQNTPTQSALTQAAWNTIDRHDDKIEADKTNLNDLDDLLWKGFWVAVGLTMVGLFYVAFRFGGFLDVLNLKF